MSAAAPKELKMNDIAMELAIKFMFEYAECAEMFMTTRFERRRLYKAFRRCFMYLSSPGNFAELKYAPPAAKRQIFLRLIAELDETESDT